MNRTLRSALIAVLAVAAVAFAATTLDSTVTPEQSAGAGSGVTGGGGEGGILPVPRAAPTPSDAIDIPYLWEILVVLAALGVLAALVGALLYRREALGAIAMAVAVAVGAYLLYRLAQALDLGDGLPAGNGSVIGGGGGGGGGAPTAQVGLSPLTILLVVGVVLAVAAVAFALSGARGIMPGGEDGDELSEEAAGAGGASAAAVGRAAGRAADRIEETTDVDNEVYRAWREMTELLDVETPETSTPGEFAAAAVDAGLGSEDVQELTRLFEDVRYGDAAVSADEETRATAVLRRIETRYAEAKS